MLELLQFLILEQYLINECLVNKIDIIPIKSSSAVSTAVSISGFGEKYFFYGFFPEKNNKLKEDFEKLTKFRKLYCFFYFSSKI